MYCRPFLDFNVVLSADIINWHTDTSGTIGYGGHFENHWFSGTWMQSFLQKKPSIELQELFAITVSILLWGQEFRNKRICLFCDNQVVVHMLNASTSNCKDCMILIRKITLHSLLFNVRIFCKFIDTKSNYIADSLSRNQMSFFWRLTTEDGRKTDRNGAEIPQDLLPIESYWIHLYVMFANQLLLTIMPFGNNLKNSLFILTICQTIGKTELLCSACF